MAIPCTHPADLLVLFMQRIYDKGLTTTSGGNLSIMDHEGNIWITPAAVDKGTLTPKDMVCVHPDGTWEGIHRPSSELPFHRSIYHLRPDLKAVLHAHPPALVSFSIVRKVPRLDLIPSIGPVCGHAQVAAYAVPGSEELGKNIGKVFADGCDIAILENHGVCIGAPDLATAYCRFETLNYTAQLEILAAKLGGAKPQKQAVTNCHTAMEDFTPELPSAEEASARRDMIALLRRGYRLGLFTATHGTFSLRLSDGSFLMTPYGKDRAYLEEGDLVRVLDSKKEAGKTPSRAVRLHRLIYENNPHVRTVLQAHPLHAMAFAVTEGVLDPKIMPESYVFLRDICKLPFDRMYTDPVAFSRQFGPKNPAFLVENDCVMVTGDSLLQAFDRLEVLELTARSIMDSYVLGQIVQISDEEIKDVKKAFHLED